MCGPDGYRSDEMPIRCYFPELDEISHLLPLYSPRTWFQVIKGDDGWSWMIRNLH